MGRFRPGITFSDFVVTDMSNRRDKRLDEKPERDFRRGLVVWVGCFLGLLLLWVRLLGLQVFGHERYKSLANENRLKMINLPSPRGEIVDRDGQKLAINEQIWVNYYGVQVPGFKRRYPESNVGVHVVGYLGAAEGKELGLLTQVGQYQVGDMVGRTGLEAYYEESLRGKNGGWLLEVDSMGKIVRDMGKTLPKPGETLRTTLMMDLIKVAREALGQHKGAVVVSNPQNGEILALVSSPDFNPNEIVEDFLRLNSDKNLPMFNRAISGTYPPGSVFKMLVTVAAIDSNKVKPGYSMVDNGFIQVGTYRYNNWLFTKHGGIEGQVGFARAITRSTDTFFYKIGEIVGPEIIGEYAYKFGLGEKTSLDLWGEEKGLIPSPSWKKTFKNENWYLGNSFHLAIGQDDLLATPLQVNLMTNILATGGTKCIPHLVQAPISKLQDPSKSQCTKIQISNTALEIVKKGMVGACSPGGTAFPLFDWNEGAKSGLSHSAFANASLGTTLPLVACKTGTAEYMGEEGKIKTHGWLTAFAPVDNPQISVTVLMEGGGEGSNVAAPVVRKILAKYFKVTDTYPYNRIPQEVGE